MINPFHVLLLLYNKPYNQAPILMIRDPLTVWYNLEQSASVGSANNNRNSVGRDTNMWKIQGEIPREIQRFERRPFVGKLVWLLTSWQIRIPTNWIFVTIMTVCSILVYMIPKKNSVLELEPFLLPIPKIESKLWSCELLRYLQSTNIQGQNESLSLRLTSAKHAKIWLFFCTIPKIVYYYQPWAYIHLLNHNNMKILPYISCYGRSTWQVITKRWKIFLSLSEVHGKISLIK